MDIGTAKPSLEEQARVPHRMIDLVEPSQVYTAATYREEGDRVLRRLSAERKPAFVAGGTGFYIRALLDGLTLPPVPPNPDFRARLHQEARDIGPEGLWRRLERLDAASATRIHPNNLPRVIRALEVIEKLGRPVPQAGLGPQHAALFIGLTMDRDRLYAVSDARVQVQIEAGFVEETRLLLAMGYDPASPALDGFGYREMVAYLEGRISLPDAVAAYQAATRRYIRRQMTWFRADKRIQWFDVEQEQEDRIAQLVRDWLERSAD
jgi:tRNA dimethylallyltransferase